MPELLIQKEKKQEPSQKHKKKTKHGDERQIKYYQQLQ